MTSVARTLAKNLNDQELAQLRAFLLSYSEIDDETAHPLLALRLVEPTPDSSTLTLSRLGQDVLSMSDPDDI